MNKQAKSPKRAVITFLSGVGVSAETKYPFYRKTSPKISGEYYNALHFLCEYYGDYEIIPLYTSEIKDLNLNFLTRIGKDPSIIANGYKIDEPKDLLIFFALLIGPFKNTTRSLST